MSCAEESFPAQLVDLLDAGRIEGHVNYGDLYKIVRASLDAAHMEGELKAEITRDPARFVEDEPDLPLALMDLRAAGKKLKRTRPSNCSRANEQGAARCERPAASKRA